MPVLPHSAGTTPIGMSPNTRMKRMTPPTTISLARLRRAAQLRHSGMSRLKRWVLGSVAAAPSAPSAPKRAPPSITRPVPPWGVQVNVCKLYATLWPAPHFKQTVGMAEPMGIGRAVMPVGGECCASAEGGAYGSGSEFFISSTREHVVQRSVPRPLGSVYPPNVAAFYCNVEREAEGRPNALTVATPC